MPDSVPDSEAGTISVSIGGNTAAAKPGTSHSSATVNAPGAAAAGAGGLEADSAEKAPGLAAAGSLKRQRTVAKRFEALLNGKGHCMVPVGTQPPIAPPEVRVLRYLWLLMLHSHCDRKVVVGSSPLSANRSLVRILCVMLSPHCHAAC